MEQTDTHHIEHLVHSAQLQSKLAIKLRTTDVTPDILSKLVEHQQLDVQFKRRSAYCD
jgi:hypothetical protein